MDPIAISAASGMRSRMESLELLANNIANTATAGFKADREFYNLYLAPEALGGAWPPAVLPVIESRWTDFSQGTLTSTGNPLDLALSGPGFFAVNGGSRTLFTRDGGFRVSKNGDLQTKEGHALRGLDGRPIRIDPARGVEITPTGQVRQDGQLVGEIEIVELPDQAAVEKRGANYFQLIDPGARPGRARGAEVLQGKLEAANFSPAEAAVRLVSVMRQFEMLQKALALGGEMGRRAVEDVARVGS